MTFNSEQIIQEVRAEFEHMIDYVTNDAAYQATADQMERGLFARLLALGKQLLSLFFALRSERSSRDTYITEKGTELPYHADRKRNYLSIFGKIAVSRPYFYTPSAGSACPLDAELSLGEDSYSDMLREMAEYLGVYGAYHKAADMLARFFGLHLSSRALQAQVLTDAPDVTDYYKGKPAPPVETEAQVLVVQADGKGVPIITEAPDTHSVRLGKGEKRGHKKEAIVTTAYTLGTAPRTPEEVLRSYYDLRPAEAASEPAGTARAAPQNKHIWATLAGKDTALERLAWQVRLRDGEHIRYRVVLCDGCEALQVRLQSFFPNFCLVLDFIHANEYLWDVAKALLGETSERRLAWMTVHTRQLLAGETAAVIAELRQLSNKPTTTATQRQQLEKTANYFERNLSYMDYATYLARGWPIASGVIEGACRHFVKDRCELSGMRWSLTGAEQLLRLRAVADNDDWDAFHTFRKRTRHERLYHVPFPEAQPLEAMALAA